MRIRRNKFISPKDVHLDAHYIQYILSPQHRLNNPLWNVIRTTLFVNFCLEILQTSSILKEF